MGSTPAWAIRTSTSRTLRSTTSLTRRESGNCSTPTAGSDTDTLTLMRFMSDFREAMWGVVQQGISELDVDFFAYASSTLSASKAHRGGRASARRFDEGSGSSRRHRRRRGRLRRSSTGWRRLGWDDVVLVERADLTSGSTFHSAGLVGQLRGSLEPHEDDDGVGRSLPGSRRRGLRSTRAGTRSGRCGSPPLKSAWRSCAARPAGRRRSDCRSSSSLPSALGSSSRRCRRRASSARRICPPTGNRPEPADVRARRGGAPRRGGDRDLHPRDGYRRRARAGHGRRHRPWLDRDRPRRQRRRDVRRRAGGWRASSCR